MCFALSSKKESFVGALFELATRLCFAIIPMSAALGKLSMDAAVSRWSNAGKIAPTVRNPAAPFGIL